MKRGTGKKMDTCKGVELNSLCDMSLSKIMSWNDGLDDVIDICDLIPRQTLHVHVRGYVDYYGGYAEHCRAVIDGLNASGIATVKLTPIKTPIDIDPVVWSRMNRFINNPAFTMDGSVFLTIAGPGWLQEKFLPESRHTIGWTMIETDTFNKECSDWLTNVDELWCPTEIDVERTRKAIEHSDKKPIIRKMRLGYDHNRYNKCIPAINPRKLRGRYVFGVLGSWNCRKGIEQIVSAFCRAFNSNDNVSLLFISKYGTRPYEDERFGRVKIDEDSDPEEKEKWTIKWEFNKFMEELGIPREKLPHISVFDVPLHERIIPHMLARFDCLVGFSKGESTWLPGLQAMAMGIPIIQLASKCGGYMEYLEDVGYLCRDVEYDLAGPEDYLGTSEYYEGQNFAMGSVEELSEKMIEVYKSKSTVEQNNKLRRGCDEARNWTWEMAMQTLTERLRQLKK